MDSTNIICPVCTLYLRPGITLKQHLSSHPKQKVIEALVKLSGAEEPQKIQNVPIQPDINTATNSQMNTAVVNQPWNQSPPGHVAPPPHINPIHGNHVFIYQQSMSTTSPQPNVLNVNPLSQHYVYPTVFNPQIMPYVYQQQQVIMSSNSLPSHMRALPFELSNASQSNIREDTAENDEGESSRVQTNRIIEVQDNEDIDLHEETVVKETYGAAPSEPSVKKQEEIDVVHEVKTMDDFENEQLIINDIPPDPYSTESNGDYDHGPVDHEECIGSPHSQTTSDWGFHSELNKACQTQNASNGSPRSQNLEDDEALDGEDNHEDQPEYFYINQERYVKNQTGAYPEPQSDIVPYTTVKVHVDNYEQSDPIYTSANILHGGDQLDFVNMEDIVIISDFASNQVISQVENFDNTSLDRPGVLMTIGDISPPKNNFVEHRDMEESMSRESSHVNIRSDEKMPARGELSGQESMGGASDITWNRMNFQEGSSAMSHSYDLIGRETWEASNSDGAELPIMQRRNTTGYNQHEFNADENDTPTVVSYTGPPLNFKCSTCGEDFSSSKNRKEHENEKHFTKTNKRSVIGGEIGKKKVKKLVVKLKSDKTSTENNFDNVFTNKLKLENNIETQKHATDQNQITQVKNDVNLEVKDLKMVCPICDCFVENAKVLKMHKIEVHKESADVRYKCLTCSEAFPNEYKYTDHLKIHPLECRLCGKLFYRRQNIQLHMKRHLGLKPFKCEICQKSFVTRQKHDEHRNVHTGETPIKCNLCDETFRRHSNLVQHRNRHHFQIKKKIKDYICHCGEIFHSKKKLAWHKEIHDLKPKACTQCSEKFVHMSSLTRHVRRAHNDKFLPQVERGNENVQCPICKGTYLRSSLDMHIKNHSGQRPFTCLICNKDFTTKWNLKLHKWTHASRTAKPFKCDQCKGAFIRESDYIAHMNSHKSVRPYTCNYCGAQFIRKYNCLRHVKEHENNKMFSCQVCGKSFHRSYYLKDHMRVHSGIRPYSCHICGKTSTTKSNHNKHVQIHHAREPVSTEN